MVATLVKLRWRLTLNALRRNVWAIVGSLFGLIYGLGLLAVALAGSVGLSLADPVVAGALLGGLGALLVAGWMLVPLLLTGVDATLDPRAMAAWIAPSRRLAVGLGVAGAAGVPGIVTGLVLLLPALTWGLGGQLAAALAALVMAPVALATCVLASRVVVIGAGVSRSRRGRELAAVVGFAVVMVAAFLPSVLGRLLDSDGAQVDAVVGGLEAACRIAGLTPLGWTLAAPGYLATGRTGLALALMVGAIAVVVLLALAWERVVGRVMTQPETGGAGRVRAYQAGRRGRVRRAGQAPAGTGDDAAARAGLDPLPWHRRLSRLMPSPAAAVAARCLRYWWRDPRYLISIPAMIMVPLFIVVVPVLMGPDADGDAVPRSVLLAAGPAMAMMYAVTLANDLAYDSTGLWQHLAAGVRGWHDRLGRVVAAWLWQAPVMAVVTVVSVWYAGQWGLLPALVGLDAALLGLTAGWGSVLSPLLPYEVQTPDESPLKSRTSGMAFVGSLATFAGVAVVALLAAPLIGGVVAVGVTGAWGWGWLVLLGGLAWGGGAAALGCWWGGRLLDGRGVRVLATIRSWPGHESTR